MAVVHIISPISFLILLSGAYLTAAMPICKTVNTQNIHLKRLQSTMNLTRHLTNETHSCNQSLPNCIMKNMDFLCNLAVLHVFTNESSFLVSSESCTCRSPFCQFVNVDVYIYLCIIWMVLFVRFCSLKCFQKNLRVCSKTLSLRWVHLLWLGAEVAMVRELWTES